MRSCGKMYGTELFTLDMPQITSNSAVHWVYRIIRDPEYKRYQLVCTKRVLDPTTFLTFLLRVLVGWHPIKCRFIIISLNKYVHGWFSSWPPINVVVTKKRYMQMNTKERPSKPFLLFLMCMFQTKRGSLVQTHLKMDVVERWTIQTINEQMGIPTMNDYVSYVGETPRVDFCAQVLEKHFAIQSKIMKVPHIRMANSPPSCIMISRQESTFTSSRNNSRKDQCNENPQQDMPRQRLNSKETITYIVKEMSRMSVRSPITKIPDSGK